LDIYWGAFSFDHKLFSGVCEGFECEGNGEEEMEVLSFDVAVSDIDGSLVDFLIVANVKREFGDLSKWIGGLHNRRTFGNVGQTLVVIGPMYVLYMYGFVLSDRGLLDEGKEKAVVRFLFCLR